MKKKQDSLAADWEGESRVTWTGKHLRLDHDAQIPRIVIGIDNVMHDIANSKGSQFSLGKGPRGHTVIKMTKLAQQLVSSARHFDPCLVRRYCTRHSFSPYFDAWEQACPQVMGLEHIVSNPARVDGLNVWFDKFRTQLQELPFRKEVENQRRVARKNADGLRRHFNRLFNRHSKLLVIRLDVGYRHEPEFDEVPWEPPSDKAVKKDFTRLKRYIRLHLPGLLSLVWKIEFGAVKGHHMHMILVCQGHQVREGITWGKVIGEKWEAMTGGAGSYWNSNANEALFERLGRRGIGLITYDDKARRADLMAVAMYVAKSDAYVRFNSPDFGRTFGKSNVADKEGNKGRPRKYPEPEEAIALKA